MFTFAYIFHKTYLFLTSLSLTKTKHVCFPSPSFEIKLKNLFSALSSAQYEILCKGYWCKIFFVFGSCIATPSTEIVNSALGVLEPSDFFSCWLNFSFWIPCFTTSIPLGLSTSVHPRNYKRQIFKYVWLDNYSNNPNIKPFH